MRRLYLPIFLLFALLLSCGKKAEQKIEKRAEEKNKKDESLQQFLQSYESLFRTQFNATGCPGAAIAIVKDSTVIFLKGFGIREVGKPDSVNEHTVFRLASLSKGFTGVLTGILVEKGVFNWTDKVISYLPAFTLQDTGQTKRIEIRHLLSHSTGVPRHALTNYIEDNMDLPGIISKLNKVELDSVEGKKYAYQNAAFSVIEEIIKVKTDKEFKDWMQELIFSKAGMKDVSFSYEEMIKNPNKALPHERNASKEYEAGEIHENYYNVAPAAGINASITDMAGWLNVLLGNRPDIASLQVLDQVFSPFVEMSPDEYFDEWDGVKNSYYGMGWRILDYGNKKLIHHGGFVNNYRSEIAIDRENKIGICVLFNAPNSYATVVIPTFMNYYQLYLNLTK